MIYNQKKYLVIYSFLLVYLLTASSLFSQNNKQIDSFINDSPLFSQNKKQIDSLINASSLEIYKNPEKAIRIGEQIVKKAIEEKNIDFTIKGYKLISDAYSSKRDYEKSLECVIKANELIKFSKDELLKISVALKTGIQYHQLKIYDKSIQYLDQSEQLILNYPIKDSIHGQLGRNYIVRGFIYKEKLNCEIAIFFFDKGIAELIKANKKANNSALSIAKYNKGNCYLLISNTKLANINFIEAIEHAKKVNAISLQAFAMKGMAKVFTLEGNYSEAIKTLNEAQLISSDVNDLILNQEIYNGLSENFLAVNDWDNYKLYHDKYIIAQNLIKQSERKSISVSLREKENELNTNLKNEKPKFYFTIGIIIIISMVFLFLYLFITKKIKIEIIELKTKIHLLQNEK